MRTDTEIRMYGMKALIHALGLVDTERFMVAIARDRFDYTDWRRHGLPVMTIDELAHKANAISESLRRS